MSTPLTLLHAPARAACAAGALAVGLLCTGGVLGIFGQAGPARWLPATPQVLAAADACRTRAGDPTDLGCVETARARAAAGGSSLVAQAVAK
jgi:hypothetical protein